MTEQDAIERINLHKEWGFSHDTMIALDMAINALEENYKLKETLLRKAVYINELEKELAELKEKKVHVVKKERWIDTKCVCGKVFSVHHGDGYHSISNEMQTDYCPECGIKLDWSESNE